MFDLLHRICPERSRSEMRKMLIEQKPTTKGILRTLNRKRLRVPERRLLLFTYDPKRSTIGPLPMTGSTTTTTLRDRSNRKRSQKKITNKTGRNERSCPSAESRSCIRKPHLTARVGPKPLLF